MSEQTLSIHAPTVNEIWKPVPGLEGYYEVSDAGRVRGLRVNAGQARRIPRVLQLKVSRGGYWEVCLSLGGEKRTPFVHTLVAAAFLGIRPPGYQVNHKDGDRLNASAANLEYVTPAQNVQDGWTRGRGKQLGEAASGARLKSDDVLEIVAMTNAGKTQYEISDEKHIHQSTVSDILTGRSWSHLTGRKRGHVA